MPAHLALLISLALLALLYRIDPGKSPAVSRIAWLPFLWVFFISSRFPSQWLMREIPEDYDVSVSGSPLDRSILFGLILAGLFVLYFRRIDLKRIYRRNPWLFFFFIFAAMSILWADYPVVALKRFVKVLGTFIMVLVFVTEKNTDEAFKTVIRRNAYALIPLSIIFIKYLPVYGRSYSIFGGAVTYHGVAINKNALGILCMVSGIFFIWMLSRDREGEDYSKSRLEIPLYTGLLLMTFYLMSKIDSVTSLICFFMGMVTVVALRIPKFRRETGKFGAYLVVAIVIVLALNVILDLDQVIISGLGRDMTLTGRTDLWAKLLTVDINPVFGTGFEGFWFGERLEYIQEDYWWIPNQAHNGYLEMYLNQGLIGLFLLLGVIFSGYGKLKAGLITRYDISRLKMGFLVTILLYNFTEATFKGINLIYFIFFYSVLDDGKDPVEENPGPRPISSSGPAEQESRP
jgi:O-antigen ligase